MLHPNNDKYCDGCVYCETEYYTTPDRPKNGRSPYNCERLTARPWRGSLRTA